MKDERWICGLICRTVLVSVLLGLIGASGLELGAKVIWGRSLGLFGLGMVFFGSVGALGGWLASVDIAVLPSATMRRKARAVYIGFFVLLSAFAFGLGWCLDVRTVASWLILLSVCVYVSGFPFNLDRLNRTGEK